MKKPILLTIIILLMLLSISAVSAQGDTKVTLLHFSDYHSHALPFYSGGEFDTAGVARAIAYLKTYADDPNALILSGGDMMNSGSPAWSDKYQCVEWAWFNGLVDAMAFGNHDADYGYGFFAQCQQQIDYPILGSNVLDAYGQPVFQRDGKTYEIFEVGGAKIGVFAVMGDDFGRLIKENTEPVPDTSFANRVETAKEVVQALQGEEVDAIVLIGHAYYEDDIALAKAVPGIDLIFGSHSHLKKGLKILPGTDTAFISPSQYLTYISKVEFTFTDGVLSEINGELVKMGNTLPEDPEIASKVAQMQADLEADPNYIHLFQPIGEAAIELSTAAQNLGEGVLGNFVTDIIRDSTDAHLAIFTSSGFRQSLPPGVILEQDIKTSMPYKNDIFLYAMTGEQIQELLNFSVSAYDSDFFSQVSGVRFNIVDAKAANIQILNNPADPTAGYSPLDPAQTYQVATSNFQGLYAGGYKEIFAPAPYTETGLTTWDEVRSFIQANSPVSAQLDGRIVSEPEPTPTDLPTQIPTVEPPTPTTLPTQPPTMQPPTPTAIPVSDDAAPSYLPLMGVLLILAVIIIILKKKNTAD